MTKSYDTIIIGAGHNGLVTAAYLAKAGQKVLVLEAKHQVGGAAVTEPLTKNKNISTGAQFLNQMDQGIIKDLDLNAHGLKMASSTLKTIGLAEDGNHLHLDGNAVYGAGISSEDVGQYKNFKTDMNNYAQILKFLCEQPPIDIFNLDWHDKATALRLGWKLRFGLGAEKMADFLRIIGMNIFDLLEENFDHPLLKGVLSFDAVLGTHAGSRSPGNILTFLYRLMENAGAIHTIKGGMGGITQALAKSATAAGADIRVNAAVASVLVENCTACGVLLNDGTSFKAQNIISNADPKTTVFDMVGTKHFEADFVHRINCIRMRGTTAKLHIALKDLPDFKGLSLEDMAHRLVIAPSSDAVEHAFNHVKYGETSDTPMMEISIPSIADPSLVETGHVLSANVQYAPYALKAGWSDTTKAAFLEKVINQIEQYAPNIRAYIETAELLTPQDLEHRFGMRGGHWHHGELTLDQMMMLRPVPLASRYQMPLDGLYLCGAGAHPGGGVMGLAGKNAAKIVLKGGAS